MPIPLPNLDNRRWPDLTEEARALIPLYAPEWTDHNVHDPGITLIELLAWMTEAKLYQINRIPDKYKWKLLKLLGILPRPPYPSQTILGFSVKEGTNTSVIIPPATEFDSQNIEGAVMRFRTTTAVTVTAARLQTVKVRWEPSIIQDVTALLLRGEGFYVFGSEPLKQEKDQPALYLGFSDPLIKGEIISIFFVSDNLSADALEKARILDNTQGFNSNLYSGKESKENIWLAGTPLHHSVRVQWEYYLGEDKWESLDEENTKDNTHGFTLSGLLIFSVPDVTTWQTGYTASVTDELHYIRCRFVQGCYEKPVRIQQIVMNAIPAIQAVSVGNASWDIVATSLPDSVQLKRGVKAKLEFEVDNEGNITALRQFDASEDKPTFLVLDFNAPASGQRGKLSLEAARLGRGTGMPNQRLQVPGAPLVQDSFKLYTIEKDKWRKWHRYSDLDAATRTSACFILDATNGMVSFGDGEQGVCPPQDSWLLATYDVTEGEKGKIIAGTSSSLSQSPHNHAILTDFPLATDNPLPEIYNINVVYGGENAEELDDAIGRAIQEITAPQSIITLEDWENVTKRTPGTHIARTKAYANTDLTVKTQSDSLGVMTLVIVPYLPVSKPEPSKELLQAVFAYLNHYRIIGTHLRVIGPKYVGVSVRTKVKARKGESKISVRQRIEIALNAFMDPLTGGSDGDGWPFGRGVYRSEFQQTLDEVKGVEHVLSLTLLADGGLQPDKNGNLNIDRQTLIYPLRHEIDIDF